MLKALLTVTLLLIVWVAQVVCWDNGYQSTFEPYSPKKYKIDLDLPPKQRWAELMKDFKAPLNTFRDYIVELIGVSPFYLHFIPFTFAMSYDVEFAEEIRAIAELSDISFNEAYLLNFVYEMSAVKACTSIIMRTETGRIIHGRNLDFEFAQYLADLSSVAVFYKNGNPLFEGNVVAGYTGLTSGLKYGKFGITLNERDTTSWSDNLGAYFLHKSVPPNYLVRKVLEKANSFDEAVKMLTKTRIIAPAYFIVSGTQPHEGVVITRGANEVKDMSWISANNPGWFIVHTNYDRDLPDPSYDYRRTPAEERLAATQQKNITEQVLFDSVLSKYPNLNLATILTAIFSAETGYYNTTMWY